jgi:hypothetical protein
MEKMRETTSEHDRQRMIEERDMEVKGGDPAITITMALTAKLPQGTRIIAIKGTTVKAQDIAATERKTTKSFRQENPESTIHHLKIC